MQRIRVRQAVDRAARERVRREGAARLPGLPRTCLGCGRAADVEPTPGCDRCRRRERYRKRQEQAQRAELLELAALLGLVERNGSRVNGRPR